MEQIKQILLGETYWYLKKLMDNQNRNQSTGPPPLLYPNVNVKKMKLSELLLRIDKGLDYKTFETIKEYTINPDKNLGEYIANLIEFKYVKWEDDMLRKLN